MRAFPARDVGVIYGGQHSIADVNVNASIDGIPSWKRRWTLVGTNCPLWMV